MRIDRSIAGHYMMIAPRYSFSGNLKSIMFQCHSCDPDGKEPVFFQVGEDGNMDKAIEEAMAHGNSHGDQALLDT